MDVKWLRMSTLALLCLLVTQSCFVTAITGMSDEVNGCGGGGRKWVNESNETRVGCIEVMGKKRWLKYVGVEFVG